MASTSRLGSSPQGSGLGRGLGAPRPETRAGAEHRQRRRTTASGRSVCLPRPAQNWTCPASIGLKSSGWTRTRPCSVPHSPSQASLGDQKPQDPGDAHFPPPTFPSSYWSLVGGLDIPAERDPEYGETPQNADARLRVGVSFETGRSASFGVEMVKEFTHPHTHLSNSG